VAVGHAPTAAFLDAPAGSSTPAIPNFHKVEVK
jgi:hypothetical protein